MTQGMSTLQPPSPPTPTPHQPPSKQMSKVILRTALQKANSAVMCDSSNDVVGAIDAYSEAISLLNRVLTTVEKSSDRRRLQEIHDSYSERIRLLSAISPKSDIDDLYETFDDEKAADVLDEYDEEDDDDDDDDDEEEDAKSWLAKPAKRKFSTRQNSPQPYPPIIRHMASSSSLNSQKAKRNSSQTTKTDPPSPVSSKSTPTRSANRRSSSSVAEDSSLSSVDSYAEPQQAIVTTPPPPQQPQAQRLPEPAMTLPPLKPTKIEAASERTSSLRHQPSNTSMRSATVNVRQSSITNSTFASVRKKSSNRLSRVSMDGSAATMRRGHSSTATPLLGLFMRSQNTDDHESSMDYFGHGKIGMAYSTDSVMPMESSQQPPLHLVLSIEKSMDQGAYITPRLYIPKNMWSQPNIRLPHVEVKVAACESLIADLAKLEKWKKLDDLTGSLKVLEILEDAVESLQANLAKKLKRDSMTADPTSASSPNTMSQQYDSSTVKKSQAFMSWGTKLSKSVERMNAFSLTKTEDQYRNYVEVLQKMLLKIHILTDWWDHYVAMKKDTGRMSPVCDVVLQRLTRICEVVDVVVGGFVVRDMAVLLGKWLKRGGTWVNE